MHWIVPLHRTFNSGTQPLPPRHDHRFRTPDWEADIACRTTDKPESTLVYRQVAASIKAPLADD